VCSITVNATVEAQLEELKRSGEKKMKKTIEKRLYIMADEADVGRAGGLDNPANTMKDMPPELRGARKHRVGRHRIFYTGHHNQCSYHTFYIKINKKKGVNDEADPAFHEILKTARTAPVTSALGPPEGSTRQAIPEAESETGTES
jgi:mRNA-degrading endonuclease RelE of RelBE toxin-antitoxin system